MLHFFADLLRGLLLLTDGHLVAKIEQGFPMLRRLLKLFLVQVNFLKRCLIVNSAWIFFIDDL